MSFRRLIFISAFLGVCITSQAQLKVHSLTTDYHSNPIGIENPAPKLSWILQPEQGNTLQASYQIRAALSKNDVSKGRKLIWESGKVNSSASTHVKYEGKPLLSYQRVYWQVRVEDNHGNKSKWSNAAYFEMGKLAGEGWKAEWISPAWEEDEKKSMPSPYMRKEFQLAKTVKSARLYVSARGLYQVEINGKRIGEQEFTPGWTTYNHRIQYQVYDVTANLASKSNALGIILGDGWFRGFLAFSSKRNTYGTELAAIAELRVKYSDGSEEIIVTDGSWKASTGPIIASDIYNGEIYDARKEISGWSSVGYDEYGWSSVKIAEKTEARLLASEGPPVKIINELEPLSIELRPEGWLVDMGQNMVGWIQIKASGKNGDMMVLRHAEVLDKEGNMYYTNLRAADQRNTFVLSGKGEETFAPRFSFQGFRYVMVEDYPGELTADKIRGMVIHSDMKPVGTFECSEPLINQLQHNIVWGLKGNFLDVPTDCPQRDERLGWTGDAQVFAPTACFNVHAASFYVKWLKDLALDQDQDGSIPHVVPNVLGRGGATGWADAGVTIPWAMYLDYGDVSILETQYESMKKWIGYMKERAGDNLIWEGDFHFGDWLSFASARSDYMGAYTLKDFIATAYYSYSSSIVGKVASILGKEEDAKFYARLSEDIKVAFNKEFVTSTGRLVSHTQTAYTLALAFDMLDEETAALSAAHLAGDVEQFRHITTGFLGTPLISLTLTDIGRNDLAYLLLNRKSYPSWLYPVTMGATTIWERWDGQKPDSTFQNPGMNSFNHYAYGAIGKWLYEVVAGIGIDEANPAYKHIIIKPRPGGNLTYAKATHKSMYGEIVSGWTLEGKKLTMNVVVPGNTTASIHIPGEVSAINFNGSSLNQSGVNYKAADGEVLTKVGSGTYTIVTTL